MNKKLVIIEYIISKLGDDLIDKKNDLDSMIECATRYEDKINKGIEEYRKSEYLTHSLKSFREVLKKYELDVVSEILETIYKEE